MDTNRPNSSDMWKETLSPAEDTTAEASTAASKRNTTSTSQEVTSGNQTRSANGPVPADRSELPPGATLAGIFRYHMGIENDHALVPEHLASLKAIDPIFVGENKGRRAVNLGIYNRAIREERGCHRSFWMWSIIINGALGLQIIFAAILTALGAANGPHDVVAIFGTLNTVIAGFLTYLKGTGLPMRMKYFFNQWLKLRAYIEQRERDFASDDLLRVHRIGTHELMEEIEVIEKMYHNIRKDIERHEPEAFGGKNNEATEANAPGEGAPAASLAQKGIHAFRARFAAGGDQAGKAADSSGAGGGIEGRIKGLMEDVERRISGHLNNHAKKIEEHMSGKGFAQMRTKDLESGSVSGVEDDEETGERDISDVALDRMRQLNHQALEAQNRAEARVKELEEKLAKMNGTTNDSQS